MSNEENPDKNKIKASIIIAAYKAVPFLDGCFSALDEMACGDLEIQVIMIDDKSPDDGAEIVKRRWPWCRVVRLEENVGFAGANNAGMQLALDWGADYIYLLNQDTEADPDFLVKAIEAAESDVAIGSVQSLLLLHPEKDLVNSLGNSIHFLGFGFCNGYRAKADSVGKKVRDITYGSGAATLYRAEALRRVGLFDDHLYMYHEDLDLGWRLLLNGWRNVLAPESVVYHKYEFARSISKFFWMERNRYLVMFQNLKPWSLAVLFPWMLLSEIGLFLMALKGGWWKEKVQVYKYLFKTATWSHVGRRRARVRDLRRVSDREIAKRFVSVIDFQETNGVFISKIANPLMLVLWAVIRRLII